MTFTYNLQPVLFSLGPLAIRWYSLFYILGFFILIWSLRRSVRLGKIKLTNEEIDDFAAYLLIGMIIGARLFEVIIWSPSYYFADPLKIFAIWEGGLAYHGGLLGIIVAGMYFARKKGISFLHLADLVAPPLAFALGFGRIGNFINGEIWGPATTVSWCVVYEGVCRHPYQLYGAAKRWIVSGVLFGLSTKKRPEGTIFFHFLWMMGLGRVLLDFLRDDTGYAYFLGLSIGQWASVVMVVVGVVGLWRVSQQPL